MLKRCCVFAAFTSLVFTIPSLAQEASKSTDWPQWRGPHRDGTGNDAGLLREWPAEGPKLLWKVNEVGVGYSSLAVKDGRVFTQGDLNGVEHILALSTKDGRVLWAVQPEPVAKWLSERTENEIKSWDKNKNGQIDETEGLARIGWNFNKFDLPVNEETQALATRRAKTLMEELDADKDGSLNFTEAGAVFREHFERMDAQDKAADAAKLAFSRTTVHLGQLDKDSDGKISRQEARGSALDRNFNRIDQKAPGTDKGDELLTGDELSAFFSKNEAGRDGLISVNELQEYYVKNKVRGDGIWQAAEMRSYFGGYRNDMGDGPRGTPTVDGDRVYAEGGDGDVTCLEANTGKTIWHVHLQRQFGGGRPGWGYSESPLVVNDLVLVTPGGKQGTLVALNKNTGTLVWKTSEVTEGAHYASPVIAEIGGIRQIVQFARESAFGVSLDDGKLLWKYNSANNGTANCCDPVIFQDHVFASSGYGTGGGLAKIITDGKQQKAEEVYFEKKVACHHGGLVRVGDHIYSNAGGALVCMNFLTGKIAWQARSVGKGSIIAADGLLFVFSEGHQVALVEATPEAYREKGRFSIESHGRPSWAHPAIANGRLYLRDQEALSAYDVRGK